MNWKDAASYDYTDSHGLLDWAWEFIRRNPDYRDEWEVLKSQITRLDNAQLEPLGPSFQLRFGHKAISWGSPADDFAKPDFWIPSPNKNRWGLMHYLNPINPRLDPFHFEFSKTRFHTRLGAGEDVEEGSKLGIAKDYELASKGEFVCNVTFDLRAPLSPQLSEISRKLADIQRNHIEPRFPIPKYTKTSVTKENRQIWRRYLRVLDAQQQGFKRSYAAPLIFDPPPNDTAERLWDETKKLANAMCKVGFQNLCRGKLEKENLTINRRRASVTTPMIRTG